MRENQIEIFTDGGSRGNPGLAGIGVVIKAEKQIHKYSHYLGENITNNEAEYQALIFALKKTKQLIGKERAKKAIISCFSDSELMVKQLNHKYKINNNGIKDFFIQIWNLILDFEKVEIIHIPREKNKEADLMANKAMDEISQKTLFN